MFLNQNITCELCFGGFREQKEYADKNRLLVKSLFDYAKSTGAHYQSESLPDELYVDHMDEEQIWQQLELQNQSFWDKCMKQTCKLLSLKEDKLKLNIQYEGEDQEEQEESDENDNENDLEQNEVDSEQEENGSGLDEEEQLEEEEENENDDLDEEESSEGESSENEANTSDDKTKKLTPSKREISLVVDDKFFNLKEMEAFLDSEDQKELDRLNSKNKRSKKSEEESDEENEIDYFDTLSNQEDEIEDDDDEELNGKSEKDMMFEDFYDLNEEETPEQKRERRKVEREAKNLRLDRQMKEDLGLEDESGKEDDQNENESENGSETNENELEQYGSDEDSDNETNKGDKKSKAKTEDPSEFELRQQRLQNRIEEMEDQALEDKPWQLKGEITSTIRPKNSLLEEVLEFDSVARPAPLITEATTQCLEDIIKRRIKSKAWDDVERKIKPLNDHQEYRKNLVLNQEKSKESLAQVYEKDFLDKVNKLNNIDTDVANDEPAEHKSIRKEMKELFLKLDALSNFYFTAKPVAPEAKIITNIPAIQMEEVAPIGVSDAALLAPEEVRARLPGDEIGESERSKTDKNRQRRKKKLKQKLMKQSNDKKIAEKEKLGIKVTTKERQQQLLNQVTKGRNVIRVSFYVKK